MTSVGPGSLTFRIYPKDQAIRIASYTKTPVLAYAADVKSDADATAMAESKVGRVDAQGQFVAEDQAISTNASNTTSTDASASNAQAAPAPTPAANRTEPEVAVGTAGQRDTNTTGSGTATNGRDQAGAAMWRSCLARPATSVFILLLGGMSLVAALALRQRRKSLSALARKR